MDDIPGGQPGLLPIGSVNRPLRVEIPKWMNSMPMPGAPEILRFYWGETLEVEKEWTAPVPPADLILEVESRHALEGTHRLWYEVMTFNGEWIDSEERVITTDRTPPTLGSDNGRLVFPPEIVKDGITADYLEENEDVVQATVPDYDATPGDTLRWYWDTQFEDDALVSSRVLAQADMGLPIMLDFPGDLIRARGDGTRMARYQVRDRAGNMGLMAGYVSLNSTANAPQRTFPWMKLQEAVGTGQEQLLEPHKVARGGTLVISAETDLREGDTVTVQWCDPDSPGAYQTSTPVSPGGREFHIPMENMAFFIAKTVPMHYDVVDAKGRTYTSEPRRVKIDRMDPGMLQPVQCKEAQGSDRISLAAVPAGGATLTLAKWQLVTADQHIMMRIEGSDNDLKPVTHLSIDKRALTAAEVAGGIGNDGKVVIPRAFLTGLKLNFPLYIKVFVSFDRGATWPPLQNFPVTTLTVAA